MLKTRTRRRLLAAGLVLVASYLLLLIPDRELPRATGAGQEPFAWNRDAFWSGLEQQFVEARSTGCELLSTNIEARLLDVSNRIAGLHSAELSPDAGELDRLEDSLFELAPLVAACPQWLEQYAGAVCRAQAAVKLQSERWDPGDPAARARLYRMLSGTRMALEEAMLQAPTNASFPSLTVTSDEPSACPYIVRYGVKVHSGDLLVSRGGAPTSALIARGNDFPGSFSHVALLHVGETGEAHIIESHIECGVTVSSIEDYLKDKKLRILVLRLRSDLPAMRADPLLPHKAAQAALREARGRHIPYDFAMDHNDPATQFCSEVASSAYARQGIRLWLARTRISSPVVAGWLASVGVRYFETEEPADLEHDPQLRIVAEWRDRETLFKAHVDDAVTDAMIEQGRPGEGLSYSHWLLPFARVSKAYSVVLNLLGGVGPVPEGMTATQALRVDRFQRRHEAMAERLLAKAAEFRERKGYTPPYWELVRMARE
ncbi:MAG TPA: hypothetical protein GYA07_10540 [Verrucomicrobia bacterium]|nr:hypothetical protein [Verrucomicrobiota bacterium]HOP97827.1 YiiX/YebB-like N1pC/P60 family cysteine hydrolase [Verrucomicrobiota bacterium]